MGLFSSPVAEIKIDFYGQKKRNKYLSNVQTYYWVTTNAHGMDPASLGSLYCKFFIRCSETGTVPGVREIFWTYINGCFQHIASYPKDLFLVYPSVVDIIPLCQKLPGKVNTSLKLQLMSNGKVKYTMTEGAVHSIYNPLSVVAMMQFFMNLLSPEQFNTFYEQVRYELHNYKLADKKVDMLAFKLDELQALNINVQQAGQVTQPVQVAQPAQVAQPVQPQVATQGQTRADAAIQEDMFCSNCGAQLRVKDGVPAKFCTKCGEKV